MSTQDTTLPPLNYVPLYEFAHANRINYSELCSVVRAAIAAQAAQPVVSAYRVNTKGGRSWVVNGAPSASDLAEIENMGDSVELLGATVKESLTPQQAQQAQGVPVAAEYRRGWDECMALWADHMKRMNEALNAPSKVGYFNRAAELYQNVKTALAAAPQAVQKESHAELDLHSNPARDEQQRQLASALEVGQPLGFGQDESASNSQPKGAIARISGMDEYGPMLEWYTHWVNFKIGTEIYAAAPQAEPQTPAPAPEPSEERRQLLHLLDDIVEEAEQDGATYYRIRDRKDILFSNMVGACARLLAQPQAPAAQAEPQPDKRRTDDYATEINRLRNIVQSACLGGTDAMVERWKQLFPDEPVPTVKKAKPLSPEQIEALPVWAPFVGLWPQSRQEIARAIEAAHGIGTKGGPKT